MIYPENTDDLFELRFTIAHELGHVCANIANREIDEEWRYDIVCQRDTPIRSGGAVWSEFIADAIGYHITGEQFERYNISELRNHMLTLLYLSFQDEQINPVNPDSVYMRSSQNSQPNSDTPDVNSRKER